jgi:hypothetical protein
MPPSGFETRNRMKFGEVGQTKVAPQVYELVRRPKAVQKLAAGNQHKES